MSIQSEISRIAGNVADSFAAVLTKGGQVPEARVSGNLAAAILTIPQGSEIPEDTSKSGAVEFDPYGLCTVATDAVPEVLTVRAVGDDDDLGAGTDWNFTIDFVHDTPGIHGYASYAPLYEGPGFSGRYVLFAHRMKYGVALSLCWEHDGVLDRLSTDGWATYEITCASVSYPKYTPAPGFLRVVGNQIADGERAITLRSTAVQTNDYGTANYLQQARWQLNDDAFREIAGLGFNTVRIIYDYRLLEDDSNPFVYKQSGWDWFDEIVSLAQANGLRVVFCLMYSQGGKQDVGAGIGLWTDSTNQDRVVAMWRAIADRYKDNRTVAGYSLCNELHLPVESNGWLTKASATFSDFLQRIIDAIREKDRNHIIIAERALAQYDMDDSGLQNAYDNRAYFRYPVVRDSNIMFEWHEYTASNTNYAFNYSSLDQVQPTNTIWPRPPAGSTVAQGIDFIMNMVRSCFTRLYGENIHFWIGEYGCKFLYDNSEQDQTALQWMAYIDQRLNALGYSRSQHQYMGWVGSTSRGSMGLRYTDAWHGSWESGHLFQALADILRTSNEQDTGGEIVGGGNAPEPSGTIEITKNGTYNVTNYALAAVNVPGGSGGGTGITVSADGQGNVTISGIRAQDMQELAEAAAKLVPSYDDADIIKELNNKANTADLAKVATSGSYEDLSNKPMIPEDQSEAINELKEDLSGLQTAVAGKYTKPSTGIPASDLASGVIPPAVTDAHINDLIDAKLTPIDALADDITEVVGA